MVKFRMLLLVLLIVGGINWGATAYDYNFVDILSNKIDSYFSGSYRINKVIYILVAISAILIAMRCDTWLPFLGSTIIPSHVIQLKTPPNATIKVKINVRPNSKIVYWAAYGNPKDENNIQDVSKAYKDFTNSGVVMSDSNGNAELSIIEGASYHVPLRTIKRHIHYRVFCPSGGMLGPVKKIFY